MLGKDAYFEKDDEYRFYKEAKEKSLNAFRCTVRTQDGDLWRFTVPDIHSFCLQMYDYFSEKVDVFEVRVERELRYESVE